MSWKSDVKPTGYYHTFGGGAQGLLGLLLVVGLWSLYGSLFFGYAAIAVGGLLASTAILIAAVVWAQKVSEGWRSRAAAERKTREMEGWIDDVAPRGPARQA